MVTQQNPIRISVSHLWEATTTTCVCRDPGERPEFLLRDSSKPDRRPASGKEAEREECGADGPGRGGHPARVPARARPGAGRVQADFAKAADKPLVLLTSFGGTGAIPKALLAIADESVDWDERALIDALRRRRVTRRRRAGHDRVRARLGLRPRRRRAAVPRVGVVREALEPRLGGGRLVAARGHCRAADLAEQRDDPGADRSASSADILRSVARTGDSPGGVSTASDRAAGRAAAA